MNEYSRSGKEAGETWPGLEVEARLDDKGNIMSIKRTIKKCCKVPLCPNLHEEAGGYCPDHLIEHKPKPFTDKKQDRLNFYGSGRWQRLRLRKLRQDPFCEVCRTAPGEHVHHVKDARNYPGLRFEWSNLQSICAKCHFKESQKESRK